MARLDDALDLLNTLIHFTIEDMVKLSNITITDMKTCLQNAQEKIDFLQLEYEFQKDDLEHKRQHFELLFLQSNPIFESKSGSNQ